LPKLIGGPYGAWSLRTLVGTDEIANALTAFIGVTGFGGPRTRRLVAASIRLHPTDQALYEVENYRLKQMDDQMVALSGATPNAGIP
jgi:hypothetical protein